jgi:uracil-DNA glycosylase
VSRTLADVAAEAAGCTKCRLAQGRTQVVFGVGNPTADVLFIGEAPGFHEDKQGEPFVGAAGQLLTKVLGDVLGLERADVYICNILKCRPPGNRDPQDDEIESCTPWLIEQVSLIQPLVIVTLGNFATKFVLQTQQGITRMRGRAYAWHGRTVIPTFHPAAILHGGGEKSRQFAELREDFELVRDTLAAPPTRAAPAEEPAPTKEPAAGGSVPAEGSVSSPSSVTPTIAEPVRVPDAEDERAPEEQLELF